MDAYAVIETGGKQYRVREGDVFDVERTGDEAGARITIERVLAVSDGASLKVGTPLVEGAAVEAEVVDLHRGHKVVAFKKKRRKGYHRTIGHRQDLMKIRVAGIRAG